MMCFMDSSFCSSSDSCANKACGRNLTPELVARGKRWWGGDDFPVAMADYQPTCSDYKPVHEAAREA